MSCRPLLALAAVVSLVAFSAVGTAQAAPRGEASLRAVHAELVSVGASAPPSDALEGDGPADDDLEITERPFATKTRWYGWQTLLADASTPLLAFAAPEAMLGGYLLGAPIVHAAHERWGAAVLSLGLRVGLPLAGAALGSAGANCPHKEYDSSWCGFAEVLFGASLGIVAAIAIDAAALSYETVPVRGVPAKPRAPQLSLTPWIDRDRKGASLSLTF